MMKSRNPFHLLVRWLRGGPPWQSYSCKAYEREWHRRQREALRQARKAELSD